MPDNTHPEAAGRPQHQEGSSRHLIAKLPGARMIRHRVYEKISAWQPLGSP